MPELNDHDLLVEFTQENSEAAFTALVSRHVNLVYSVALRKTGDPHAADEITQAVFIMLAKKARGLSSRTILAGWLCETARLTAANYLRTEIRRQKREQEAYVQSLVNEPQTDEVWRQIAPLLDDAIASLNHKDRNAVVLRFFENQSLQQIGQALGASEDAVKMRVNRALEKLRKIFAKRGVNCSAVIITGALSTQAIQAAPLGVQIVSATGGLSDLAVSASVSSLAKHTLQQLLWTKLRTAMLTGVAISLVTVALVNTAYHRNPDGQRSFSTKTNFAVRATGAARSRTPSVENALIQIKLNGTPGLPFELVHSAGGLSQSTNGVLPATVSFLADAFSADIHVQGQGEFSFEIYRGDLQQASSSLSPVTNAVSVFIEARAGGQGISVSGKRN